jgi:hypothetical protein
VLLGRAAFEPAANFLQFYNRLSVAVAATCIVLTLGGWRYFSRRTAILAATSPPASPLSSVGSHIESWSSSPPHGQAVECLGGSSSAAPDAV